MKTTQVLLSAATIAALTLNLPLADAQEKKIDRSALPAAVVKTVAAQSVGATIKGFATERENGKTVYEAEMIVNGHTRDIQIAEDGTLNEIEEELAFDALPSEVQTALKTRVTVSGAKITKVESLTKKDRLVAYEATTLKGTKKGEIQVGPDGKRLSHAE